MITRIKVVLIP